MKRFMIKGIGVLLCVIVAMLVYCPAVKAEEDDEPYLYMYGIGDDGETVYGSLGKGTSMMVYYSASEGDGYSVELQWYKKVGESYQEIAGENTRWLTIDEVKESDFASYYVEGKLLYQGEVVKSTKRNFQLVDKHGLSVTIGTEEVYYSDDTKIPACYVNAEADEGYQDKIRYQWFYTDYDEETDDDMTVDVQGATGSAFTPTKELLEKQKYFQCRVTLEGVENVSQVSDWATYMKVYDTVKLADNNYSATVNVESGYTKVTRKFVAEEGKQGITFTFRPNSRKMQIVITDENGKRYSIDATDGEKVQIKGREAYVTCYVLNDSTFCVSQVTQDDTFVKQVLLLEMVKALSELSFEYGDEITLDGVEFNKVYNDGTKEKVQNSELEFEKDTRKYDFFGYNPLVLTLSGTSITYTLYMDIISPWTVEVLESPKSIFYSGTTQTASIKVATKVENETIKYIWTLKNSAGKLVELDEDTESSITLPTNLVGGEYTLQVYYYSDLVEYNESNFVNYSFYVIDDKTFEECSLPPESRHNFDSISHETVKGYLYQIPGATSLRVKFDARTKFEVGDFITVYDETGSKDYTGDQLAGKELTVQGDKVKLFLYVGRYSESWGFNVTEVEALTYQTPSPSPTPNVSPTVTPTVAPTPTAAPIVTPNTKVSVGKVTIKSTSLKKKKMMVKWKKVSGAKGYQVQVATNKALTKGKKSFTVKGMSKSFKKMNKKTYYVRVRAYKVSEGKKIYGKWSAVKKVKQV